MSLVFNAVAAMLCVPLKCGFQEGLTVLNAVTAVTVEDVNERRPSGNFTEKQANGLAVNLIGYRLQAFNENATDALDALIKKANESKAQTVRTFIPHLVMIRSGLDLTPKTSP